MLTPIFELPWWGIKRAQADLGRDHFHLLMVSWYIRRVKTQNGVCKKRGTVTRTGTGRRQRLVRLAFKRIVVEARVQGIAI